MRLNKLIVAILGISVAGPIRAADEVVEYRQVLETWVQPLEKRDMTCTGSAEGSGLHTTTCTTSQTCYYGSLFGTVACIPDDDICCDWQTALGWCPQSLICTNDRYAGTGCNTRYTPPATTIQTTTYQPLTPTLSPSQSGTSKGSGSNPLSAGSIAGIAVSIVCSVLSLIFGIAFKIWKHKKKVKQEQAQNI